MGGTGSTTVKASNVVNLMPGTGAGADAVIAAQGAASVTALSCAGCSVLSVDPATTPAADAGVYGFPATVTLLGPVIVTPSSVLQAIDTAQSSGEGDTPLAQQQEEGEEEGEDKEADEQGEQSDGQTQKDQDGYEKRLPVCM
jgi:hypothetical protein